MNPRTWPCRLPVSWFHEYCLFERYSPKLVLSTLETAFLAWIQRFHVGLTQHRVFDDPSKSGNDIRWVFSDNRFMLPAAHWSFHPKNAVAWSANSLSWPPGAPASSPRISRETCHSRKCCYPIRAGNVLPMDFIHRWSLFGCRRTLLLAGRRGDENAIYRIHHAHGLEVFIADAPGVSGLAFGPDGRLYGCRWSQK